MRVIFVISVSQQTKISEMADGGMKFFFKIHVALITQSTSDYNLKF